MKKAYRLRFTACRSNKLNAISNKIIHRGFTYQVRVMNFYRPLTTIPEVHIAIQPQQSFESAIKYKITLDSEIVKQATGFYIQKVDECVNMLFNFLLRRTCDICGHFEDVAITPEFIVDHKEFYDLQGKQICRYCVAQSEKVINDKLSVKREEILKEEIKSLRPINNGKEEYTPLKEEKTNDKVIRTATFTLIPETIESPNVAILEEPQEYKYVFVLKTIKGEKRVALYKEEKMTKVALEVQKVIYGKRFKTNDVEVFEETVKKRTLV